VVEILQTIKGKRVRNIETIQATGSTPMSGEEVLKELHSLVLNAAFFTTVTPIVNIIPTPASIPEIQV
jgi:hypothetical protein